MGFIKQKSTHAPDWDLGKLLTPSSIPKVLPKLRGDDSPRIRKAFTKCQEVLREHDLARCLAKVEELTADLEATEAPVSGARSKPWMFICQSSVTEYSMS